MRRQPPTPPPPRRQRSRSPLTRRREGLLELLDAHARNIQTRRGGRQARVRTRARGIHRGLLQLLKEHVFRLLAILARGPCHRALSLRIQQIDQRLVFLRDNWVEDKRVVLPGLRDWPELRVVEPDIEIESASEIESILYLSSDKSKHPTWFTICPDLCNSLTLPPHREKHHHHHHQ